MGYHDQSHRICLLILSGLRRKLDFTSLKSDLQGEYVLIFYLLL